MDEQIALLDAIYSADIAYWQLSRSKSYLETISEYVAVVDSLRGIVKRRFDEGYSAKGDLLQIESRISDARYQLSSATQSYLIALHNYNSLRGAEIDSCVELMESIFSIRDMPSRISAAEVVEHHPRYQSMLFGVEGARWGIKTSEAEFLPSLHLSIYGSAEPQTPHIKGGGSRVNGGAVLSLSVPIFHFGERREAMRMARSDLQRAELWWRISGMNYDSTRAMVGLTLSQRTSVLRPYVVIWTLQPRILR
jgi:outer membrane protein TolC